MSRDWWRRRGTAVGGRLEVPTVSVEVAAMLCEQTYPTDVSALGQAAYLAAGGWRIEYYQPPVVVDGLLAVATAFHPDGAEPFGHFRLAAR